jgi:hypothetical protein
MDGRTLQRWFDEDGLSWRSVAANRWRITVNTDTRAYDVEVIFFGDTIQFGYRYGRLQARTDIEALVYYLDLNDRLSIYKIGIGPDNGLYLSAHWPVAHLQPEMVHTLIDELVATTEFLYDSLEPMAVVPH